MLGVMPLSYPTGRFRTPWVGSDARHALAWKP